MVKTGATTAVTYAVAGPAPAAVNLVTSVGVDEVMPEEPKIDQIETKEQSAAYIADSFFNNALYALIAFLLITNILVPLVTNKMAYTRAKIKYKVDKGEQ